MRAVSTDRAAVSAACVDRSAVTDLCHLLRIAEGAVRSGAAAIAARPSIGSSDGAASSTTHFDLAADRAIVDHLRRATPGIDVHSEESGRTGDGPTEWLVDALSATGHHVRGTLWSSCMVALVDHGVPLVAAIYDLRHGHLYTAAAGSGAFRSGVPLRVSTRPLEAAYIAAEVRLASPERDGAALLKALQARSTVVTMANYGWQLSMVAAGALDGFVASDCWGGPWDLAPGALLVQEAGGTVTDLAGEAFDLRRMELLAAPPQIHEQLVDLCGRHPLRA